MKARTDVAAVFKRIVASIPQQQRARRDLAGKAWRWAEGVHVFPDAICPFCNVVMRSSCLWQIDETAQRIVKVTEVDGKRPVAKPTTHPHAYTNGTMCMGSVGRMGSVAQAALMSINPNDCMGGYASGDYGTQEAQKASPAWKVFFDRYFPEHKHLERKRRARPKLFTVAKAVAKAKAVRKPKLVA